MCWQIDYGSDSESNSGEFMHLDSNVLTQPPPGPQVEKGPASGAPAGNAPGNCNLNEEALIQRLLLSPADSTLSAADRALLMTDVHEEDLDEFGRSIFMRKRAVVAREAVPSQQEEDDDSNDYGRRLECLRSPVDSPRPLVFPNQEAVVTPAVAAAPRPYQPWQKPRKKWAERGAANEHTARVIKAATMVQAMHRGNAQRRRYVEEVAQKNGMLGGRRDDSGASWVAGQLAAKEQEREDHASAAKLQADERSTEAEEEEEGSHTMTLHSSPAAASAAPLSSRAMALLARQSAEKEFVKKYKDKYVGREYAHGYTKHLLLPLQMPQR